jgi:prephenate dehydrogenase
VKQTVLVAGLGLIGGSLAKAIALSNQNHVIGYDINPDTLAYATENKIIHESFSDFNEAAALADYIFLAAPISGTIQLIKQLDNIPFTKDVVVTDVASVKGSIIQEANLITNKHIIFIGGHPMSGSHKQGVTAAKSHLFENAIYVLIPTTYKSEKKVQALKNVLRQTKSRFITLNSSEHDEMTGVVSHFPHLIASSLVQQAKKWENRHAYLPHLAAGGFRDITRIASSNPELWQDIFYHNRAKMVHLLEEWITEMTTLKQLVEENNKKSMIRYLTEAKEYRDGLGHTEKGAIPSFYDLYVDIKDKTGAIASVAKLLSEEGISINNIQILEIRDGITGALRLSVSTSEAQQQSFHLLQKHGYRTTLEN